MSNPGTQPAICGRIRDLRLRHYGPRGKRRFANDLELPLSTYCTYEASRQPAPDVVARIAHVTGCDVKWLLTGQEPKATLPAREAAIVERLAALVANRPQARRALEALAELLMQTPVSEGGAAQVERAASKELAGSGAVIPIIGRTAAGHVAFWPEGVPAADLPDLYSLAQAASRANGAAVLRRCLTSVGPPYHRTGEVEIIQFPEPIPAGRLAVAGVLVVPPERFGVKCVAVRIDGDSMAGALLDGDYVIADPDQSPGSGDIALAGAEGQVGTSCKVFLKEGDRVRLIALNPAYPAADLPARRVRFAWRVVAAVRQEEGPRGE